MCAGAAALGIAIGLGHIGDLIPLLRLPIAAFVIFPAVFGFYHGAWNRKIIHIDISGTGQCRLAQAGSAGPCANTNWPHLESHGAAVALLKDSTIWPHLLLLRLQTDNGKIFIVPILPDSVSRDSFRALSAACRWIASRSDSREFKNS